MLAEPDHYGSSHDERTASSQRLMDYTGPSSYLAGLEAGEIAFFRGLLLEIQQAAPQAGSYQPYVSGGHFNEADCLNALYEEAESDGPEILGAVLRFLKSRRWPRLRQRAKFFLVERLTEAAGYCDDWLRAHRIQGDVPLVVPRSDVSPVVKTLVSDYWREVGCRAWVEANASTSIDRPFDHYSEDEQREMDGCD